MGGRGSSGGNTSSGVFGRGAPLKIESRYIERHGFAQARYDDTVLDAVDLGNGRVELVYAKPVNREKLAKTNKTNYVTYSLKHGFVNDTPHNINFDKIKEFHGKTYAVKEELKRRGYKYSNGVWVK